jgi:hypothetical protein
MWRSAIGKRLRVPIAQSRLERLNVVLPNEPRHPPEGKRKNAREPGLCCWSFCPRALGIQVSRSSLSEEPSSSRHHDALLIDAMMSQ